MVGIERAAFYTSHYFIDLATLAKARGVPENKYYVGLGQKQMAVFPPDEDIVTASANAARTVLTDTDTDEIGMLLFATESGIDQSKAAGLYLHRLLDLPKNCRVLELKQACYSATAGIMLALEWLKTHPNKKVLVIASDIARYGLNQPGEPSQGGGAVALLLSNNPQLISFETGTGIYTEEAMDFWRPNYREEALVDGKYSCDLYLKALKEAFTDYEANTNRHYADHDYFLFHIPLPRMAEKGMQKLAMACGEGRLSNEDIETRLGDSLIYSRTIGNCYTASLYLGLLSLLEHRDDLAGKRIGLYSYGSGAIGEFFSGKVMPNYTKHLFKATHQTLLDSREELDIHQYEAFYGFSHPKDGSDLELPKGKTGAFRLKGYTGHQRIYEPNLKGATVHASAPAKLILTGEHAVVQGVPAIAIAINRYCKTTVTPKSLPNVLFDLVNLEHKRSRTLHYLSKLKNKIREDYHEFQKGGKGIRTVLAEPFHLLEYTAGAFVEKFAHKLDEGFSVTTDSSIPTGCGLGSSAAAVVSLNYALNAFSGKNLSIDELFEMNLDSENLQHGKSSGLDIYVSAHGGCIYFQNGQAKKVNFPDFPLSLVLTGQPESSTGECVAHTRSIFEKNPKLIQAFEKVSLGMLSSIESQDFKAFKTHISKNEALLEQIGVVPAKVVTMIRELEKLGFAAKVCGAGAISGDAAGVVLIAAPASELKTLPCLANAADVFDIILDQEGVRLG